MKTFAFDVVSAISDASIDQLSAEYVRKTVKVLVFLEAQIFKLKISELSAISTARKHEESHGI